MATTDPSAPQPARSGWRGRRAAAEQRSAVQHGWQRRGPDHPHERLRKQQVRTRNKVLLCLLAGALLAAGLLAVLLYWPRQTPVIYIGPTNYQWPVPPQSMAFEDLEALKQLDRQHANPDDRNGTGGGAGSDTLELIDISDDWDQSQRSGLARFQQELRLLARDWTNSGPIILYVCMHGVSDEQGRPFLVPPDASPTDVNTWLEFDAFLGAIEEAGREHRSLRQRPKLLVLDCNRMTRNWRMGLIRNRFTEGVQRAVQSSSIPNLAVLNSVSQDEQAWVSQAWQASVFGYFLREGLAGKASQGDRKVTALELEKYLQQEVGDWARRNRGAPQQPRLWMTDRTRDFTVAHAGQARFSTSARSRPSEEIQGELPELWRSYHAMRDARVQGQPLPPTQTAVLAWHRLEHNLIWLQQLAFAGQAYAARAGEVLLQVKRGQEAFERSRDEDTPAFSFWNGFDDVSNLLEKPTVHSVPLCRQFGLAAEQDEALAEFQQQWEAALASPTEGQLTQLTETLRVAVNEHGLPDLIEGHLPHLVSRYWFDSLSSRAVELRRVLQLRQRAESLAAPLDHRTIEWLREPMFRADQLRRRAEDMLFVDDGRNAERLQEAEQAYDEVEHWRDATAAAYAVRDRCGAELPNYALWFTRPEPAVLPSPGDRVEIRLPESHGQAAGQPETVALDGERVVSALSGLIDNSQRLGQLLAEETSSSVGLVALNARVAEMERDFLILHSRFQLDCERLQEAVLTRPEAVRDIERVLSLPLPLAHATQRSEFQALLEEYRQRSGDAVPANGERPDDDRPSALAAGESAGEPSQLPAGPPESPDASRTSWEKLWSGQRDYPALMLLEAVADGRSTTPAAKPDDREEAAGAGEAGAGEAGELAIAMGTEGDLSSLDSQERRLRQRLRDLPSILARVSSETRDRYRSWSRAERMLRAAAPLVNLGPGLLDDDPIDQLRRYHLQQLLVWHGQRGLNDVSPRGLSLAAEYRDAATLVDALSDRVARQYGQLAATVEEFGRRGLQIGVESLLLPVADANVRVTVRRTASGASSRTANGAGGDGLFVAFPPSVEDARATLFARGSRGQVVSEQAKSVELPLISESAEYELTVSTETVDRPTLDAVLMFRGFEYTDEFLPERIGGFRVAFEPEVYDRSSVRLDGQGGKRLSVIFVLDCSESMRKPIEGEQREDARPRMEIAKSKLEEMLRQLARERDIRVGAIFFGHRRGWSRTEPVQALTQERYAGVDLEELEALQPGEDVEAVLKLGRFDPLLAEQVIDKLETVQGWGQTPLYRSLVMAQNAFAADDPDTEKRIVVITDGRNFEYGPPNNPLGSLEPTDVGDVLRAWEKHRAKVHIVSLGLQDTNVPELEREFRELARETDGSYVAARNAPTLTHELQSLLGKGEYELLDERGRTAGYLPNGTPGPAPLGQMLVIRPTPDVRTPYILQYRDLTPRIDVQPGDALELEVSRDGQFIAARPYDENGLAEEANLVMGERGAAAPMLLRVHPPVADTEQQKVQFRLSLQMANLDTTPRPAESWVEITPLGEDLATAIKSPYFFYDANYQANRPVPVLAWEALDWPYEQSRHARVRFWCKPDATPVPEEGRVVLRDLLQNPESYATPRELTTLAPGVRVRIEADKTPTAFRIDVVELHRGPDPDMGALKVRMQVDPNAPLREVTRQFDEEHGIAVHSFVFPASADSAFRRSDQAQLHFIPGHLVKDGAWQLPADESLVVPIANDAATLPSGPSLR